MTKASRPGDSSGQGRVLHSCTYQLKAPPRCCKLGVGNITNWEWFMALGKCHTKRIDAFYTLLDLSFVSIFKGTHAIPGGWWVQKFQFLVILILSWLMEVLGIEREMNRWNMENLPARLGCNSIQSNLRHAKTANAIITIVCLKKQTHQKSTDVQQIFQHVYHSIIKLHA